MSILITGGVKSGKSSHALKLSEKWSGSCYFLATATGFDDEMKEKIRRHQEERDSRYITVEEPVNIDKHIHDPLILDCLTLWMNNIIYQKMDDRWEEILHRFLSAMPERSIIVTNEIGMGNIPADPESRRYNNSLGQANKMVSAAVDQVYLMVAGIPVQIK